GLSALRVAVLGRTKELRSEACVVAGHTLRRADAVAAHDREVALLVWFEQPVATERARALAVARTLHPRRTLTTDAAAPIIAARLAGALRRTVRAREVSLAAEEAN